MSLYAEIIYKILYVQTFTHIPQPMHSVSEIVAILSAGVTSIHSFPVRYQAPYTVNRAFLFRAHHVVYPFWRPDTTSCTPGDISWACICPGSRWLFEWASLAPPLLRSTVCATVVQSRHVRANIPRRCISRDRQFPAKEPWHKFCDRDRSCAR